jgi:hypothetical protein
MLLIAWKIVTRWRAIRAPRKVYGKSDAVWRYSFFYQQISQARHSSWKIKEVNSCRRRRQFGRSPRESSGFAIHAFALAQEDKFIFILRVLSSIAYA